MNSLTRFTLYLTLIIVFCINMAGCGNVKPNAPSGLTATVGDGRATISWNNVLSTTYRLYWSTTSGGAKNGTVIDPVTNPYVLTGLTNGTTYYIAVIAIKSGDESPFSSEVSVTPTAAVPPPAAPTKVSAAPGIGKATISWTAVTGASSYHVYYSTSSLHANREDGLRFSPSTASPQEITGLAAGIWYFVVTAVNTNGESIESTPVVSATVQ
ncbi:MAG: fibronectin type III domain-containing protein [Desulfuromonadaceae bacterium]|nr:fibronectin type III domain-containing protein [Desulfuromonadaceae bacterium]